MKKKTIIVFSHYVKNSESKYLIYTHNHTKEYVKRGYKVIVFAPFSVLPIFGIFKKNNFLEKDGVQIYNNKRFSFSSFLKKSSINFNGLFYFLSVIFKIRKIIKTEDVVMFDAHNFDCGGYSAYLLKKMYPDIPTFITFHGSDLEEALSYKIGIKRLIKVSKTIDYYVCVSDKLRRNLNKIGINNSITIYNGINLYEIKLSSRRHKIITVGDLIESKNFSLLIDGFYKFSKQNNNYELEIIGEGNLKNDLQRKIEQYGLEDKVKLLGSMSNKEVYNKLSSSYAFILASKPEGFGIVYPEAMYCGCITIGTKGEGIDGFIKNNFNGFLIEPTEKEIVDILNYITKTNCDKLIQQGKIDAMKLTWEKNCQEYIDLIKISK